MKIRINKISILLLCFIITGCAVYKSKLFQPAQYIDKYSNSRYKLDTFDNWNIYLRLSAYERLAGADPEVYREFFFEIDVSTNEKNKNMYNPSIQNVKILYGDKSKLEIDLTTLEYDSYESSDYMYRNVSVSSDHISISDDINLVTVSFDIIFINNEGDKVLKQFAIPMELVEKSELWWLTV